MRITHLVTLFGIAVLVFGIAFLAPVDRSVTAQTGTQGSQEVAGFAWSSNIGWIKFRGNTTGGQAYGATYNSGTGALAGYAWSPNIGWIQLNPSGAPAGGTAKLPVGDAPGDASGWIRALAGGSASAGGWDGWIKLAKAPSDSGASYKVYREGNRIKGWAWGSDVVGWVNFDLAGASGPDGGCPASNPDCEGVTIGGLSLTCTVSDSTPEINQTLTVTNTASGGRAPYTYCWGSGCNPPLAGSEINQSASQTSYSVTVTSDMAADGRLRAYGKVVDSDSKNDTCELNLPIGQIQCPANEVLINNVCECRAPNSRNSSGVCVPPASVGAGTINVVGSAVMSITEQASGPALAEPFVEIKNEGDAPVNNLNVSVVSTKSGNPTLSSLVGGSLQTYLCPARNSNVTQDCNKNSLAPGESLYLTFSVPRYIDTLGAHNPFRVTVSGATTGVDGNGQPTSATVNNDRLIIFNYLVGGVTPQ